MQEDTKGTVTLPLTEWEEIQDQLKKLKEFIGDDNKVLGFNSYFYHPWNNAERFFIHKTSKDKMAFEALGEIKEALDAIMKKFKI